MWHRTGGGATKAEIARVLDIAENLIRAVIAAIVRRSSKPSSD
jgi:hypothetical protein